MVTDSLDAHRQDLAALDQEIADLQKRAAELRLRIGERADYPTDLEEVSMLLTEAEEQEAVLATLKGRRDQLAERLGQH
jgi:uncharacterized protein involved in exopolysaccharide biosynthesis